MLRRLPPWQVPFRPATHPTAFLLLLPAVYVLPRQPPIRHPVRSVRLRAHPPPLVLLVGFEIAFEPFDVAVALEGEDVGGEAVEEEAVVADHDGAAGEI